MNENNTITDAAILERSFSFCNEAMKTISLQVRRLQTNELEDSTFVFRKWADLRFLILSLDRLDKAVKIAENITSISEGIKQSRKQFRSSIPWLSELRNIGEHIDAYSMDKGKIREISRKSLQVGTWSEDGMNFTWMNKQIDVIETKNAAIELFSTIKNIKEDFFKK